jgi:hypothetical protein
MSDKVFVPNPSDDMPYLGQMFRAQFPGADLNHAARAWQYAKQHGLDDANCYRYMVAACGFDEDGQRLVQLTPEQKAAAKYSGVSESTYARELKRLEDEEARGWRQTG